MLDAGEGSAPTPVRRSGPRALGVRVEAEYAVGDYDIAILSAQRSDGLVTYLNQEGYKIPNGAESVLADYIADGMKFFVARVNLDRHAYNETQELRPLQIAFRSQKFMLPLQLGKVNSVGTQDMLMMMLVPREYGRIEAANYENTRIPSNVAIPVFIRDMFTRFYKRMFDYTAEPNTVYTEYAWDMGWCDPCAEDPLNLHELRELGAIWVRSAKTNPSEDVFVTRMHIQYTPETFQRDLEFNVTFDTENFQGRYIMNNPFDGELTCEAASAYIAEKQQDIKEEGDTLQRLTNWRRSDIDDRIRQSVPAVFH